jgi:hypothetical protein
MRDIRGFHKRAVVIGAELSRRPRTSSEKAIPRLCGQHAGERYNGGLSAAGPAVGWPFDRARPGSPLPPNPCRCRPLGNGGVTASGGSYGVGSHDGSPASGFRHTAHV